MRIKFIIYFLLFISILSSEKIQVRGDVNYPPFEYLDKNGHPTGFNVDLINAISEETGLEFDIKLGIWSENLRDLEEGKIDMLLGMYYTKDRDLKFDFTLPFFQTTHFFFKSKDSNKINPNKDKYTFLAQKDDISHEYLIKNHYKNIKTYPTYFDVIKALSKGEGDFALLSLLQVLVITKEHPELEIMQVGEPVFKLKVCMPISTKNKELLFTLNEAIMELKHSGKYDKIYEKWFAPYKLDYYLDKEKYFRILYITIFIFLLILFIILLWVVKLKKQNILRTKKLLKELFQKEKIQSKLTETEQKYRDLSESLPLVIFETNAEGEIIYINQFTIEHFHLTQDYKSQHYHITDLLLESEKQSIDEAINKKDFIYKKGKEVFAKHPNGIGFPATIYTSPFIKDEKITGYRGILVDDSQRKSEIAIQLKSLKILQDLEYINKIISQLDEKEELLQKVLKEIKKIFHCNRVLLLQKNDSNDSFSILYEVCDQEFLSYKKENDIIKTDSEYNKILTQFSSSKKPIPINPSSNKLISNRERYQIQSLLCAPIEPQFNKPYIIELHQCASKREWEQSEIDLLREIIQKIENAINILNSINLLKQSEAKYKSFIKNLTSAIFVFNKDKKVEMINSEAETILKLKESDILGKRINQININLTDDNGADFLRTSSPIWKLFNQHIKIKNEIVGTKENGMITKWLLINGFPLMNEKNQVEFVIINFLDITERKQMEDILKFQINTLKNPNEKISNIKLQDLFDLESLQNLQDKFASAFGLSSIITDTDYLPITQTSNPTLLCNSHNSIGNNQNIQEVIEKCKNVGLQEASAKIVVGNTHIANWFIGHALPSEDIKAQIMSSSETYGYNKEEIKNFLEHIPIISEKNFIALSNVLNLVANQLSLMAYKNLIQAKALYSQKMIEKDIVQIKAFLNAIINSIPMIIIGLDNDGKIIHLNSKAIQFFNLPPNIEKSLEINELLREFIKIKPEITNQINLHQRTSYEKITLYEDDNIKHFSLNIIPLDNSFNNRIIVILEDISERIFLQEVMIQSGKMMSVGGLAAGMAHEINNPLAGIMQNAQVIRNRVSEQFKKNLDVAKEIGIPFSKIQEYMEKRGIFRMIDSINLSGEKAAGIIQNMLKFSRKSDQKKSKVYLPDLIDETINLASNDYNLTKNYDFKKLQLRVNYEQVEPIYIIESEIQQVILNILKNGAEAMLTENHPEKKYGFFIKVSESENHIILEIEDNGPGLKENIKNRIFEPFFTTKSVGKGTGLGLSVSYYVITENHKGKMFVQSQEGHGTKFIIELPKNVK